MSRKRRSILVLAPFLLAACTDQPTQPDSLAGPLRPAAAGEACGQRANVNPALLLECVTLAGVRSHQAALQAIADANNGTRASGLPGYDASVGYVAGALTNAGYDVVVQPFEFFTFLLAAPSVLEQISPPPAGPLVNTPLSYSGSGDVTAPVTLLAPPPADATPGCDAADFAGFPAGNIALISRGSCTFAIKATNAYNAGATGVVIYNNVPGVINGTLGAVFTLDIPVTSVTQNVGQELAATPALVLRIDMATLRGTATTYNVIAETRGGNPDNIVMIGAHLDAVNAGPGINDNGSGVAAVLETAIHMNRVNPANKVRFAFWGAEEAGLLGSRYYVNNLSPENLNRIALYLNFDMIGSPNHVFFVYDGDDSDGVGAGPGPQGSAQIEALFEEYFARAGHPYKGTDFSGRSDYAAFIDADIPAGGLFTGAEGIKTAEEAALWGGTAGVSYDPCYHQACDTYANNSDTALDVNADGVAYATIALAMSTERVNGIKGRGNAKARGSFKLTGSPAKEPGHALQDR